MLFKRVPLYNDIIMNIRINIFNVLQVTIQKISSKMVSLKILTNSFSYNITLQLDLMPAVSI